VTVTERPGALPSDKLGRAPFGRPRSRRAFLVFGVAAGLGLAGCSSKSHGPGRPASSPPAGPPAPSPTPLPGTVAAAVRENDLAGYATAALRHFGKHLTKPERHLLSGLRDAHLAHAAVLGQVDPTMIESTAGTTGDPTAAASPSATSPSPTSPATSASVPRLGRDPKSTLNTLRKLETEASKSYASLVAQPGDESARQGELVLLWGSLATAAAGYAALCSSGADPGAVVVGRQRAAVALPDQDTAMGHLLSQCYAIIFGYQSAIAYLSEERAEAARGRLADYRDLRDRLAGLLSDHKATVPAPDAAYQLPVQPISDSTATRLITLMETRMLPYLGAWLATARADDRSKVLAALVAGAGYDLGWSAKINVWPGYPTA